MKRSRPPRPGVKLNRNAVWELPGRPGMSQNEPARRSYGNAAGRHLPPSRGRPDQGLHSPLRRPNPGRSQGHRRDNPRASPQLAPGEY